MRRYVLTRMVLAAVTMAVIITLTFFLLRTLPNSLGTDDPMMDPALRLKLQQYYGLNESSFQQYLKFFGNILKGDFGTSNHLYPGTPVYDIIFSKFPINIQMNLIETFFVYPLGLGIGIIMALKKGTAVDNFFSIVVMFFISVPAFVIASLAQYFFAFKLGWFPILLSVNHVQEWVFTWEKIHSMMLPIIVMTLTGMAGMARAMRGELAETLTSDFMLLAKTKGLTHRQALFRHALRNAFVPMAPMMVGVFTGLLGGSLYLENVFGIPGIGGLITKAMAGPDIPLIIAWMLLFSTLGLFTKILVDLTYGFVDPRIRMGGRRSGTF